MKLDDLLAGYAPALVMFDLDGTLVDSVPDLAAALNKALQAMGRDPVQLDQVRDWVGNGVRVLVRRALAGSLDHEQVDDELADQALQSFMQFYSGGHELTTVYPGVIEFLDALRANHIPMAIVTNKPERFVRPILEENGLNEYFPWIVGGDTLPQQKPDPEPLLHVLRMLGVSPGRALFIGDSRNDVLAAVAAEVPCIAVSYGYNHGRPIAEENPLAVVNSLSELI